jgi:DNA-binding response OmpR family regulator
MKETILIIEDDEMLRSNVFQLLEFEDFNVLSA